MKGNRNHVGREAGNGEHGTEGGRKETGKGEPPGRKECEWVTLGKRAETELKRRNTSPGKVK